MRMRNRLLAAVALVTGLGSLANANITVTALREADVNLPGYDAVLVFALNDGAGVDGGKTGIVSVNMTITDNTSSGLVMGVFKSGTKYAGDPDGSNLGINGTFGGTNKTPVYNTSSYPGDSSDTGSQLYSWVGNGRFNTVGWSMAAETPVNTLVTSVAATGYQATLQSFNVQGGWTTAVDATALNGGVAGSGALGDGSGAFIGVAVVPHNDVVNFAGQIGGQNPGSLQTFNVTNPTAVPEPASLGVLALGVVGLIARRRK